MIIPPIQYRLSTRSGFIVFRLDSCLVVRVNETNQVVAVLLRLLSPRRSSLLHRAWLLMANHNPQAPQPQPLQPGVAGYYWLHNSQPSSFPVLQLAGTNVVTLSLYRGKARVFDSPTYSFCDELKTLVQKAPPVGPKPEEFDSCTRYC